MQELMKDIAELFHAQDYPSIVSVLLALGLQINEKFPGITLDKVKNEIGTIIDLTDVKASMCFNIVSNARDKYCIHLMEKELHPTQNCSTLYLYLLRLALMTVQSAEQAVDIDDLPADQMAVCEMTVKTIVNRAVKLSQANGHIQKLEQYRQKQLYSDDEQTVVKKKAVESILADFRTRRCDYLSGNDAAFNGIESANRKHLNVLKARESQAFEIFASVLVSLTVVGLVVGVGQMVKRKIKGEPAAFLFYKERSADEVLRRVVSVVAVESVQALNLTP